MDLSSSLARELLGLLSARKGHFRLESGHHGGMWLDLDPLFLVPRRTQPFVAELAEKLRPYKIDAVCGPLVGGGFLALEVASYLNAEFYYAERFAPPARDTLFAVEYRLPPGVGKLLQNKRVAIVDDAVSAGSAVRGTLAGMAQYGAIPVAVGALLVLGDAAAALCAERNMALESLVHLPYDVWLPSGCPMCASGVPLEDIVAG